MSVYVFLEGDREDPVILEEGVGWVFDISGTLIIEDKECNPIAEFPDNNVFYVSTVKAVGENKEPSRLPGIVKE